MGMFGIRNIIYEYAIKIFFKQEIHFLYYHMNIKMENKKMPYIEIIASSTGKRKKEKTR